VAYLHLTLDHASWHWVQASSDLNVIQGQTDGRHTLQVDLADANHSVFNVRMIAFTIPEHWPSTNCVPNQGCNW
jgi:hypothetical protein